MRLAWRVATVCLLAVVGSLVFAGRADAQLGSLLSPGPLAKAHANLEGIGNCSKCHEQGRKVPAQKCLACHAPVAQRIARKTGVHKDVAVDCVSCHAEHAGVDGQLRPFDQAAFDHATTGFPLTGKHALGAERCTPCHKGRSFLEARSACVSCHADIHKGSLGANCVTCHSTQVAFKASATAFDHSKAAFALTGAHKTAACTKCHATAGAYKGVKFASCADCHKDPHRASFGATCTSCHTTEAWQTKSVNHARTAFPLTGQHARVDCASCHTQPAAKVKVKFDTCASCHEDAHRGNFRQDCKACHSDTGWKGGHFDHASTTFALAGRHDGVACEKCHRPGVAAPPSATPRGAAYTPSRTTRAVDFRGLKTTCASCHEDVHRGTFPQDCKSCHSDKGWKGAPFDHGTTAFKLTGRHDGLACEKCHRPGTAPVSGTASRTAPRTAVSTTPRSPGAIDFRGLKAACATCHEDVHRAELGAACESCHSADTFSIRSFTHRQQQTAFFAGLHAALACAQCHPSAAPTAPARTGSTLLNVRFTAAARSCVSCHKDVHLGQVSVACETCHSVETAKFAASIDHTRQTTFPLKGRHASVVCRDCHKVENGQFPTGAGTAVRLKGFDTTCRSCHADVHLGQLAAACERCHSVENFHVTSYTHSTRPVMSMMTGAHARAACVACHKPTTGKFPAGNGTAIRFTTGTSCVSCHVDQHRGTLGPNCSTCHRP